MKPLFLLISLSLALASCSCATKVLELDVTTKNATIAKAGSPRPVSMNHVEFYVVNEENLQDVIALVKKHQGEFVVMAFTPKGYENMSLNLKELQRYLREQKSIIIYYEKFLYDKKKEPKKD